MFDLSSRGFFENEFAGPGNPSAISAACSRTFNDFLMEIVKVCNKRGRLNH